MKEKYIETVAIEVEGMLGRIFSDHNIPDDVYSSFVELHIGEMMLLFEKLMVEWDKELSGNQ